jgi:cell division protein FtsQ
MNLYFNGVCVKLGKSNFDKKIVELPPILEKLEGKEGTLFMEHYTSGRISFKENPEE